MATSEPPAALEEEVQLYERPGCGCCCELHFSSDRPACASPAPASYEGGAAPCASMLPEPEGAARDGYGSSGLCSA